MDIYNYTIFINVPGEIGLFRRMTRDVNERNIS